MKEKCYVDANLKVVRDARLRKAVVNMIDGRVEILFLSPVAHNKRIDESWAAKAKWAKLKYPRYQASLPTVQTCKLANSGLLFAIIKNCYTSSDVTDYHGRRDFWYALDCDGKAVVGRNAILENVFVSLFLTKEQFYEINPDVCLED